MVATALVVALLLGVPPLLFGLVRRVRRRYKAFNVGAASGRPGLASEE